MFQPDLATENSRTNQIGPDVWTWCCASRRTANFRAEPSSSLRSAMVGLLDAPPGPAAAPAPEPEPAEAPEGSFRSLLLVEDNPGDIRLVREALAGGPVSLRLKIAHDGLEALTLLQRSGTKPDLILLDLNMPCMDGRSFLRRIKSDPGLLRIPVIVLTNSDAPQDVWSAYNLHANCYLVKPADFVELERALRHLVAFWAGLARLPG